jgi:hypothetical protein
MQALLALHSCAASKKNPLQFTEPEISLSHTQESAPGSYSDPDKSNPRLPITF